MEGILFANTFLPIGTQRTKSIVRKSGEEVIELDRVDNYLAKAVAVPCDGSVAHTRVQVSPSRAARDAAASGVPTHARSDAIAATQEARHGGTVTKSPPGAACEAGALTHAHGGWRTGPAARRPQRRRMPSGG